MASVRTILIVRLVGFKDLDQDIILCFRKCGESNSVNTEITENCLEKVWPKLREGHTDDQIYNADETGLFFKMLPTHNVQI